MLIMTFPTPQQPKSLPKFLQSLPSNIRPLDFWANASNQLPSIQHETTQCESIPRTKETTTKWNFITSAENYRKPRSLSWSGTEAASTISIPLVNFTSRSTKVPDFTQPNDISGSSAKIRSHRLHNDESLDGEVDTNEVAHTRLQHKQATASNSGSSGLSSATTSIIPAPVSKEQYSESMKCGLRSKESRLLPEPPSVGVSDPSICDTISILENLPIRTRIGSSDSDKYALRSFGDKAGLYYSSTIWPEELPHRRRGFLFGQLRTDLNNHIQKACTEKKHKRVMRKHRIALTGQAFTIELRFSGNVSVNEDIELRPTIWVLCASEFYRTLVEEALSQRQLSWAVDEHIEVVNGLAFNKRRERVENLDLTRGFRFADSYRLHMHIEEAGEDNSACGLVTCATITKDGCIIDQCISRVGGLLLLNQEVVCASSTAHGILDMLMSSGICSAVEDDASASGDFSDSDTGSEAESDSAVGMASKGDDELIISAHNLDRNDIELPDSSTTGNIKHWTVVPKVIIFDFLRTILPNLNQCWTLGAELRAHDFTLFEFGREPFQKLSNSYEYKSVRHTVITTEDSQNVDSRNEITILLGRNTFARGRMLPGISNIYMAGVEFNTRRICLDGPLAPGTSGSWVVSDNTLHGVIIASYGQDPIAHMIPVQQLFYDIKSALPQLLSISLPPGKWGLEAKSKEIKRPPVKQEPPVSSSNVAKLLATSSLPTLIIWRLPLNISETELEALLASQWDWFDALLLPPKECEDSTSRFAVIKFRSLTGALQTKHQLDGKRISCSGDALIVDIIDYNEVLGRGSFEGLLTSEGENSTATSVSWAVEPPTSFASPAAQTINAHQEYAAKPLSSKSGGSSGHTSLQPYRMLEKNNFERITVTGISNNPGTSLGDEKHLDDIAINDGKRIGLQASDVGGSNPPCNTLYIANLPIDASEEELKSLMTKQQGYKRMGFRTKQNGPMCFVEFENVAFATKALHELNGRPFGDGVNTRIRLIRAFFSKNPLGVRFGRSSVRSTLDKTGYVIGSSTVATDFDGKTTLNSASSPEWETSQNGIDAVRLYLRQRAYEEVLKRIALRYQKTRRTENMTDMILLGR